MIRLLSLLLLTSAVYTRPLIFILAGQSNMSGRGGVHNSRWDRKIPPESHPSPSILRLNSHLKWVLASEPLHADIDPTKTCGVGPGLPFANHLVANWTGTAVSKPEFWLGLVPCAVGGTKITEWGKGKKLYNTMVKRAKAGVRGGVKLGGVVWYQGESDTVEKADAEKYRARMEEFIGDLRHDLGDPAMLFMQVLLASGEGTFVDAVRKAQLEINVTNVVSVDAKGLALESDRLHLTARAQVGLGKMLALAYLDYASSSASNSLISSFQL